MRASILFSILLLASDAFAGDIPTIETPYQLHKVNSESLEIVLDSRLYDQLRPHSVLRLTGFPVGSTEQVDLALRQTFVVTPDTRMVTVTEEGETQLSHPQILTFRGSVVGKSNSSVALTVAPDGCKGIVATGEERYLVEPVDGRVRIVAGSTLPAPEWPQCQVDTPSAPAIVTHDTSKDPVFRICKVAVECDYEYWAKFTSVQDALMDIYTVFNAINGFYEDDLNVRLVISYWRLWGVSDPYSYVGGLRTGLDEFEAYWRANHNPGQPLFIERDIAHLMSGRGVGAWAEIGKLCDYDYGFSISGGNGAGMGLALDHDIYFVGHEIGHNFNGIHTHCFNPPLDHCVAGCNSTYQDCSTAPGTIMSYCHNCGSYGSAIRHEFAPENVSRIRTEIDSSCLLAALANVYVDENSQAAFEDGSFAFPFRTIEKGARHVLPLGTVWIATGDYSGDMVLWQSAIFTGYSGTVVVGP